MTEDLPLLSVCCIAYNHEPYIVRCLEGIMAQQTTFKFEVIVHDDASTDNSAAIIHQYASRYPDIIKPIYQTENQYSKRFGIIREIMKPYLRGKYIAMCECDDYWIDPFKLQKQVDYMEAHPDCTMTFHNAFKLNITEKGRSAQLFSDLEKDGDLPMEKAIYNWVVPTASMVMVNKVFDIPAWVPKIYGGDLTMLMLALHYGRVHYIDMISSVYLQVTIQGGTSVSSRYKWLFMLRDLKTFYEGYDEGTNHAYHDILEPCIAFLKREIRYHSVVSKYKLARFLFVKRKLLLFQKKFLSIVR